VLFLQKPNLNNFLNSEVFWEILKWMFLILNKSKQFANITQKS